LALISQVSRLSNARGSIFHLEHFKHRGDIAFNARLGDIEYGGNL
jgi:hypothetical protein